MPGARRNEHHKSTAAYNAERARDILLQRVAVPADLVSKALVGLEEALEAKETKFFTHRGDVVSTADVVNWAARAAARDQIFSIAGLYAKQQEEADREPAIAIEVDANTGVIRMVVGGTSPALREANIEEVITTRDDNQIEARHVGLLAKNADTPTGNDDGTPTPVIRRGRNIELPEEVRRALFDD